MLTLEECRFCKGKGIAEQLEEKRENGWFPNKMLTADFADAWIAADKDAPLRWNTCICPVCHGDGTYDIEHFSAKIF